MIPRTVDEYLIDLTEERRELMEKVRQAILEAAPKADEVISYRIPTYKQNGPLVHLAAFKNHCSLVVVDKQILSAFQKELKAYKISGVTIHFSNENPLPASLVKKIVKLRVKQNSARKK